MNTMLIQFMKILIFALISTQVIVFITNYFLEGKHLNLNEKSALVVIVMLLGGIAFYYSNHLMQDLIVIVFLVIVGVIDYYTKTIVDGMMYIGGVLFAILSLSQGKSIDELMVGLIVGLISYGVIYIVAKLIYKREAFGFGDVMLMGVIGIYLGVKLTLLAALLTFYVALIWIIASKIVGSVFKRQMEIAFAPFMGIACIITMLFGEEIIKLYMTLFMI